MRSKTFYALLLMAVVGCQSLKPPFVHKSEKELEELDARDRKAAEQFYAENHANALAINDSLCKEMTVSRPLFDLERISILLVQGRCEEAFEIMKKFAEGQQLLFSGEAENRSTSVWHGENNKIFRGENHERSTFYALLAMAYIEHNAYDDAIRCVKNGLLADYSTLPGNKYSSDYALLHYLGFVASRYLNDEQSAKGYRDEYLQVLKAQGYAIEKSDSGLASLVNDKSLPNAFLVVWTGLPPCYVRSGAHQEIRYLVLGKEAIDSVGVVTEQGERQVVRGLADLNFQASTRGGRQMDNVLADKAAVKSVIENSKNIFSKCGYYCVTGSYNDGYAAIAGWCIGGCCYIIGGICYGVGELVHSEADVRSWKCLPANMRILPLRLKPGRSVLSVHGYMDWDRTIARQVSIDVPENGISITHFSLIGDGCQAEKDMERRTEKDMDTLIKTAKWSDYEIR